MPRWIVLTFVLLATPALAQNSSALINEALDKQQPLQLDGTMPQVIKTIADKTGVRIEVAPGVYDLLPWGEQTTVKAQIENQTLRNGLRAIARRLGLTIELRDEAVELVPLPPLRRLGRRATVEELEVLDLLARTPLELPSDRPTVKQLLAAVDAKLEAGKSIFAVEDRAPDAVGNAAVAVARNAMLLDALESIPQATDATWYPWGGAQRGTLVVRPKVDHVRDLLNKTITRRFGGVDVGQVLAELATLSGVNFAIEPGSIQRIAGDSRNIRLILDNAPIAQALESIAGFTGLAWSVNEKGVYVWNPGTAAGAGANREPSAGLIMLDNGMQVVVRESHIPADLREYVKHKTAQHFEKMRQQMKEEGFKPTTLPATTQAQDL
ncbi:MAG: hypothetical protein ABIP55_01275 [Tepidisphaeraceae bacterium]